MASLKFKQGDTVAAWYIDAAKRRHDFKSATVVGYEREFSGWRLDVGGLQIVLPAKQIELISPGRESDKALPAAPGAATEKV